MGRDGESTSTGAAVDPEPEPATEDAFAVFVTDAAPRLRRALAAGYGVDDGADAAAAALAWAFEHWDRLAEMANPVGYLYRVGQSSLRARREPSVEVLAVSLPPVPSGREPEIEPGLPAALAALTGQQRTAVLLVHGYAWTHDEVGALLDISVSTVRNHLARGMEKLRNALEVDTDA